MARFDIYIAKVWFSDIDQFRNRPVIQVKGSIHAPDCFALISTTDKELYSGDIIIEDLEAAGLKQPSRIRLGERLDFPKSLKTRKPIGRLSEKDIKKMLKVFYQPHKIKKHYAEDLDDDFTLTPYLQ